MQTAEVIVIIVYLGVLLSLGVVFRRFNAGDNDYFRAGCRGSWWMVGMSAFMASISVTTFTANARLAFEGGWSVAILYGANALLMIIVWLFLAARFRQMRVITFPQVVRKRFGASFQQGIAYFGVFMLIPLGALQLYSLAIFAHGMFDLPVVATIVVLGATIGFYATLGGNWAVMAADFLQGIILIPITLLLTVLCLMKVGGLDGLFSLIAERGLTDEYQIFQPVSASEDGMFSVPWFVSLIAIQVLAQLGLFGAPRFFSAKDGKAASNAALFCAVLTLFGAVCWFIPPITARLLFESEVLASVVSQPSETSFAVAARELLPSGTVGLMLVAMLGASLSTMDTALNRNSAIIVEDLYPSLMRLLGRRPSEDGAYRLLLGRVFTVLSAILISGLGVLFASMSGTGAFDVTFTINALLTLPYMIPLFYGIVFRKTPRWAGWLSFGVGLLPALPAFAFPGIWPTYVSGLLSLGLGSTAFFISSFWWKRSPATYRSEVDEFFRLMKTPVDFEKEVGQANDAQQARIMSRLCFVAASAISLLLMVPGNSFSERLGIFMIALFITLVGAVMARAATAQTRRTLSSLSESSDTEANK